MDNRIYENAIRNYLDKDMTKWTPEQCSVWSMAYDIDTLRCNLIEYSRRMARRFEEYAKEVDTIISPPTNYSTINDIRTDWAKLQVRTGDICSLVDAVLGVDTRMKFIREVQKRIDMAREVANAA